MVLETFIDGFRVLSNVELRSNPQNMIICLHGNSSAAETFIFLVQLFEQNPNILVMAIDLPGCGISQRQLNYSMDNMGKLITGFILSFKPVNIYGVGHSLGGSFINIY